MPANKNDASVSNLQFECIIYFSKDEQVFAKNLFEAKATVENEIYKTVMPRWQNDVIVTDKNGVLLSRLPWIGKQSYNVNDWYPTTKTRPECYGEWIDY